MFGKEVKKQLEKLNAKMVRLEELSIMILNAREGKEKIDSAALLNEYLMGETRDEN